MTGINHIAGGVVFTGIFASLWNINIFSTLDLFLFTCISTILPDIDHPKSLLGKMFYPISRWIDRNWGHRTVTHSLIFLFLITILSLSIEQMFHDNRHYTVALFFAVFSHYILDMVTVQGIPLFFPFARNPCVIPANPNYRIRSNNKGSELKAFAIFLIIGVSCINLFQHGFWTSYNRTFGTLRHLHRENANSKNLLLVDYDYIKNDVNYKGTAYVLYTKETEAIIFDDEVIRLSKFDNSMLINHVKPLKTNLKKVSNEIGFFNILSDSLIKLTHNKVISGQIQSSEPVELIENNISKKTNLFKLDHSYDFQITYFQDSIRENIRNQIKLNQLKLKKKRHEHENKIAHLDDLNSELKQLKKKAKRESDLYLKNKYQNEIIELKALITQKENSFETYQDDPIIVYQINLLKSQLKQEDVLFSGVINYPVLPVAPPDVIRKDFQLAGLNMK
ncbi:MAG: metal-dependent hydrolase [Cyclobacteriaceae bacterium]